MSDEKNRSYSRGRHGAHSGNERQYDDEPSMSNDEAWEKRPKHYKEHDHTESADSQPWIGHQGVNPHGVLPEGVEYHLFRDPQGQLVWLPVQVQPAASHASAGLSPQEERLFQNNQVPLQPVQNGQGAAPGQSASPHMQRTHQQVPQSAQSQARSAQQQAAQVAASQQPAARSQQPEARPQRRAQGAQDAQGRQPRRTPTNRRASQQGAQASSTALQVHPNAQARQRTRAQVSEPAQSNRAKPARTRKPSGNEMVLARTSGANGKDEGKKKDSKNKGWKIVFIASIAVLIAALLAIGLVIGMYFMGRSHNKELLETAQVSDFENVALEDMTVDWAALEAINPDVVGWIYMPGTVINYPVVQTTNNETYLYVDFNGSQQHLVTFGTIFVDYMNAKNFTDRNNFIYGHNMNDGSMFAPIAKLIDSTEFNEHRTIYLLTPNGNFRLRSFACVHVAATARIVQTTFASDEAYTEYIQDKIDQSVVTPNDTIPKASEIKKSFAFSTCDDTITSEGRIILFAYVAESTSDYAGGLDSTSSQANGATQDVMDSIGSAEQATKTEE